MGRLIETERIVATRAWGHEEPFFHWLQNFCLEREKKFEIDGGEIFAR